VISGISRIIKVLESASQHVTCPIIYSEDKHIEETMVVSMRCEIIPDIVFIGYLSDFQSLFNMVIIYLTQCGIIHNVDAMY
jgi:hypothetical protein